MGPSEKTSSSSIALVREFGNQLFKLLHMRFGCGLFVYRGVTNDPQLEVVTDFRVCTELRAAANPGICDGLDNTLPLPVLTLKHLPELLGTDCFARFV